jgi:hypothetical protein
LSEVTQATWYNFLLGEALKESSSVAEAVAAADLAFAMQPSPPEDPDWDVELALDLQSIFVDVELARSKPMAIGEKRRGPSGRMFIRREDGKVVPFKETDEVREGTAKTHPGERWQHPRKAQKTVPGGKGETAKQAQARGAVKNVEEAKQRLLTLEQSGEINPADEKQKALILKVAEDLKGLTGKELSKMLAEANLPKSGVKHDQAMRLASAALKKARDKGVAPKQSEPVAAPAAPTTSAPTPAQKSPEEAAKIADNVIARVAEQIASAGPSRQFDPAEGEVFVRVHQIRRVLEKEGITDPEAQNEAILDATHRNPANRQRYMLQPYDYGTADDEREGIPGLGGRSLTVVAVRQQQPEPVAAPPVPPAPAPVAAKEVQPSAAPAKGPLNIEGRAEDPPHIPKDVEFNLPPESAPFIGKVFGGEVPPALLAAMANAMDGAFVTVQGLNDRYENNRAKVSVRTSHLGLQASRSFFRREDGKVEVHNDLFKLDHDSPYRGQGAAVFLNQVRSLRAGGVDVISTSAAGSFREAAAQDGCNGYITWPKFGYDGEIDEGYFEQLPPEYQQAMGDKRNVQTLMALPGGPEVWELHGNWIELTFDLADNSPNMQILNRYLEKRRSQPERPPREAPPSDPEVARQQKRVSLEAKIEAAKARLGSPQRTAPRRQATVQGTEVSRNIEDRL